MSEPQRTTKSIIKNDEIFYCVIKAQALSNFWIALSCTVKEELGPFLESIKYAPYVILTLEIELQSKGFGAWSKRLTWQQNSSESGVYIQSRTTRESKKEDINQFKFNSFFIKINSIKLNSIRYQNNMTRNKNISQTKGSQPNKII
jgi:Txe/YoeB family toxin of Txe-Axe toxin-antitoxin module